MVMVMMVVVMMIVDFADATRAETAVRVNGTPHAGTPCLGPCGIVGHDQGRRVRDWCQKLRI
jgi:hypothetical protein